MQFTIFGYFRINQPMKPLLIAIVFFFTITRTTAQIGWCGFTNELDSMRQDSIRYMRKDQYFTAGLSGFRAKNGSTHIPNPAPACTNCFSSRRLPQSNLNLAKKHDHVRTGLKLLYPRHRIE